jgi:hypothetical protein
MKTLFGSTLIVLMFIASANLFGQKSEQPSWLVISQNMVRLTDVGTVNQLTDSIAVPILNELVAEGMLDSWGQFNHAWGDEWNVNFWYVTESQSAFAKFWDEYVTRVSERYPGAFGEIVQYFQAHKDNMYVIRNQYQAMPDTGN